MPTTRTDPPSIGVRSSGWPARRAPRWTIAAGAVLMAVAVAVGISHHPTTGQRATDLRSFLSQVTFDIQSCSGGVRESLLVLRTIDAGASHDLTTALRVAGTGAQNCAPANSEQVDDLVNNVQVPESLASYHLQAAVTGLVDWAAPDAMAVMQDIVTVLTDRGQASEAAARAALHQALLTLDAQRTVVYAALDPAIRALSPQSRPPVLYG